MPPYLSTAVDVGGLAHHVVHGGPDGGRGPLSVAREGSYGLRAAPNATYSPEPTASAHAAPPPSSPTKSSAESAERVSFHKSAGRTTLPISSSATIPCCCPATPVLR